jgi:hypothetical protein
VPVKVWVIQWSRQRAGAAVKVKEMTTLAGILGAEGQSLESPVRYKGHARFEEGGGRNTVRLCTLPLLDLT